MIMMHQCRFIDCSRCSTLVGDDDNGGSPVGESGTEVRRNSQDFPLIPAVNLKSAKKMKSILKRKTNT